MTVQVVSVGQVDLTRDSQRDWGVANCDSGDCESRMTQENGREQYDEEHLLAEDTREALNPWRLLYSSSGQHVDEFHL